MRLPSTASALMDPIGTRPRRIVRLSQGVAGAFLVAFALHAHFGLGEAVDGFFNDWVYNGLVAFAALLCLARAVRYRAYRVPWLLLGTGLALWSAAEITSTVYVTKLAEPPYPSIADALWLAFYPVTYLGLVLHVRERLRGQRHSGLWLDGLIAALAVGALVEVVIFRPLMQQTAGTALEVATDLAYPLADLVLLSLVFGIFAVSGWRPGRAWALFGFGLACAAAADCIYAYQAANGTYVEGTLLDALWPAATLLVGYAAWEPAGRTIEVRPSGLRVLVLPVLFGATALVLLVYDHFTRIDDLALGLATATLIAVLYRTALTFRENLRMLHYSRREAMTDPLTGLGNRRRLMTDLLREVDDSSAARPSALVLFDLDGFKRYNDSFGHPAGDALLARLGRNLAVAVERWGFAYRLGGDEFCALVQIAPADADELVRRGHAALTEEGGGVRVSASHGMVFLPLEAGDPATAMQVADQRLYGNKGDRRRQAANEQTRDVLLQVLHERQPKLHDSMHDVAKLATAVGRRLSLNAQQLDEMAHAAELHDVGKMAVPDEILNKPGPLDHVELAYIRQHTIVGERILAAAPSLAPVAAIVRASHERWDGSGYPDGLEGEAIPLAARIIAACDAFHAMTSERPHQAAVAEPVALAELRRCAGSHFDPAVIEALCAEVEAGRPAPPARPADDAPDTTPLDATFDSGLAGGLSAASELD